MKIAVFSDAFFPLIDGVTVSIGKNMRILSENNEIFFFIPSGSTDLKLKNSKQIELKSFPIKSYKEYKLRIPSFFKAYTELKKINPDIIHVHTIFGIGWEGIVSAKLLKIPIVATSHTVFPEVTTELDLLGLEKTERFKRIAWRYMISFLRRCNAVIAPSEAMKKDLISHGLKIPIYPISNGIKTESYSYVKRKEKDPIFLSMGRLVESKQVNITLKAFSIFKKKGMKGILWLAGKGVEEKSLKEYVKKENLNEYVKFLGFVEYEKTPKIYQEADIFVTSSKTETEGMSTIEAMSTGLPVIGVKERATPYLVGKDAGFIAPIGNSKKIAEYMERLAKNYKLRIKLGKNASLKTKRYEIKSTNKKIYEAYKKIISDFKKRKN